MRYVLDSLLFAEVGIYSGISLRDLAGRTGEKQGELGRVSDARETMSANEFDDSF
jgi:hypothetical protein